MVIFTGVTKFYYTFSLLNSLANFNYPVYAHLYLHNFIINNITLNLMKTISTNAYVYVWVSYQSSKEKVEQNWDLAK